VEHKVGPEGLKVWEGKTAGQEYRDGKFHLKGGKKQLYVKPDSIQTSKPQLTQWPEA